MEMFPNNLCTDNVRIDHWLCGIGREFYVSAKNGFRCDKYICENISLVTLNEIYNICYFVWIVPVVFYTCVVYGLFCFLIIARKWPSLMQQWELVESKLPHWRTQYEKRQLAIHIKMVAIVVLLCSLGEY